MEREGGKEREREGVRERRREREKERKTELPGFFSRIVYKRTKYAVVE